MYKIALQHANLKDNQEYIMTLDRLDNQYKHEGHYIAVTNMYDTRNPRSHTLNIMRNGAWDWIYRYRTSDLLNEPKVVFDRRQLQHKTHFVSLSDKPSVGKLVASAGINESSHIQSSLTQALNVICQCPTSDQPKSTWQ